MPKDNIKVEILEKLKKELLKKEVKISMWQYFKYKATQRELIVGPTVQEYEDAFKSENVCSTSCCLGGLLPRVSKYYLTDRFIKHGCLDFNRMVWDTVNDEGCVNFIYDLEWNNDVDFAIERIDYVIKHKRAPKTEEMAYYHDKNRKE